MLSVSPWNLLFTILNLLILLVLMKKFLYKPVLGIIAKRQELIDSQPCVTLKDLQVKGGDLMAAGLKGKAIGACLEHLLNEVMAERLDNQRDALLAAAAQWKLEVQG